MQSVVSFKLTLGLCPCLFHCNSYINTKCCRFTCTSFSDPKQMWLIKPLGVKWPMLCQRDKPELEVRPVQLARSRHLSQTHSKWHTVCLTLPLSARGPRGFSPTPTPISVGLHTHAGTACRKYLITTLFLVPCAATNDQMFSSWMNSSLILNKISLSSLTLSLLNLVMSDTLEPCLLWSFFFTYTCIFKLYNKP